MQTQTLPQVTCVSRPAWRRVLHDAMERIASWQQRRRELEELRSIAQLDHRILKDIGWPDDMRRNPLDPGLRGDRW